jgi:peptide/nickel transport system ATP-binding protein
MPETPPAVEVSQLSKVFRHRHAVTTAVDRVDFTVPAGRSLAIVGESGSGKTTLARMLAGLERPTSGTLRIGGRDWTAASSSPERGRAIQIVFQDPYSSLDPRQTVSSCLGEVLRFHFGLRARQQSARVAELLDQVGLDERIAAARPRVMSGGQRQRVAIARALAAAPGVLILDEAVASLDVSIQAQILNLLVSIRRATGISYLFISHDLAVVRQVTDDMIVMREGQVVEEGPTARVLDAPKHTYTRLLRDSVPRPGWKPARAAQAS